MKIKAVSIVLLIITVSLIIIPYSSQEATAEARYPIDSIGGGVSSGLPSTGYYDCIAVGNINTDSYLDFVCGGDDFDGGSSTVGLYYFAGDGTGTWTSTTITPSSSWAGIDIADCDNDGKLEVYAGNEESSGSGVGVWEWDGLGFGTGGISSPLTNGGVNYVNIMNITGGSGLDMVVATHSGMEYYEGSGSSPISWTQYSTGLTSSGQFCQSAVADFNNDGLIDIVSGDYGNGLFIFIQNSSGSSWDDYSSTLPSQEQSGRILGIAAGDVNEDGNVDIVYARRTGPSGLYLLLGNGGGVSGSDFQWTYLNNSWVSRPSGTFYQMHLDDVDLDGDLDLLAPKEQYGLYLYLGNGSESPGINFGWTDVTGKGLPTTMRFFGSNFIDFDNDGDLDIAGCTWGDGIHVYENNITLPDVPIARAGSDQIIYIGNTAKLDGTNSSDPQDCPAGDSTGTILTYDWNLTSQPSGSVLTDSDLSPSDSVAEPSFVPTHAGDYILTLSVRDTDNRWSIALDQIRITVILTNAKPLADAGSDQEVEMGTLVTLDGSGSSDVEDTIVQLLFDWNVSGSNPAVVTLNDESVIQPTFTAPSTVGVYEFTLVVRDILGAWSNEDSVSVTVGLPPNNKPIANAGSDFTAYSNTTIFLNGTGSSDSDGIIITWDWNCTSHTSLTITNENSSIPSFTPTSSGSYIFTLTIKDDRNSWADEDAVIVTVIDVNTPPVANAGDDFNTLVNETTYLNGSGSIDMGGSIVTWNWTCASHPDIVLMNENSSAPSFIPDKVDIYVFILRVKDDLNLWSGLDFVNITVKSKLVNKLPVANAGVDITVYVNNTVILDGTDSYDEDGNIITWAWRCTSHPTLTFINENSSQPSLYLAAVGIYDITLRIKDNNEAWSLEDSLKITVEEEIITPPENHPPNVELTNLNSNSKLKNSATITWIASDVDDDQLTFTIELLATDSEVIKTLVDSVGTDIRTWEWDTDSEEDGGYMIRITASDGTETNQDTSEIFEIKNTIPQDSVNSDESIGFFSSSLGIGLLLVFIIIIIIILLLLLLRSKNHSEPPYNSSYQRWDKYGSEPARVQVSEPENDSAPEEEQYIGAEPEEEIETDLGYEAALEFEPAIEPESESEVEQSSNIEE